MVAESNAARYEALTTSNTSTTARAATAAGRLTTPPRCPPDRASRALRGRIRIDVVLAEVVRQVALVDAEQARRLLADAARTPERLDDGQALAARQDRSQRRLLWRDAARAGVARRCPRGRAPGGSAGR